MADVSANTGGSHSSDNARRKRHALHIDMTPMVDLAFLLLTFFMLTTTLLDPRALPVSMPDKPSITDVRPPINREKVIHVLLAGNDKIYWYRFPT